MHYKIYLKTTYVNTSLENRFIYKILYCNLKTTYVNHLLK